MEPVNNNDVDRCLHLILKHTLLGSIEECAAVGNNTVIVDVK